MRLINLILLLFIAQMGFSQISENCWKDVQNRQATAFEYEDRMQLPKTYRVLDLDLNKLQEQVQNAPLEFKGIKTNVIVSLPVMPSGYADFEVYESPVMSATLAAKFPKIKSYKARGINNKLLNARFDISPQGFHASIATAEGKIYLDPEEMSQNYICYRKKDLELTGELLPLACGYTPELGRDESYSSNGIDDLSSVSSYHASAAALPLRVYRLALACTGEYGAAKGGTINSVMASFNTALNRVNQIFELEVAVRVEMIDNNEDLIFLDPTTDPYINSDFGGGLLGQNIGAFNGVGVTIEQYDLGHVFTMGCTDVGGVVSGRTCEPDGKMRGVTCHYTSNIETIAVDVMSHEIGHQFSCGHSWNNCPSSIEQLSSENAFEPGSGSTIMSYAGACGDQNIQFDSDDYYNIGSVEDFIFFSREGPGACGEERATSNNEPAVEIGLENDFFIPISTPFELDAVGSDPDGDAITYCWEQYDLGPVSPIGNPLINAPLFRTFPPTTKSSRTFPRIQNVLANLNATGEVLPTYSRDMTFRCTVRDNNLEAGGTVWDEVRFKATEAAGPFRVTYPSAVGLEMEVGDFAEINWAVANTDGGAVNCQQVDIFLSTDGGFTFDMLLLGNTPNDGSERVVIPNVLTNMARIKVKAADNIFFDVSNSNFKIVEPSTAGYSWGVNPAQQQVCLPNNAQVTMETFSLLDYDENIVFLVKEGLPQGAAAEFTSNPTNPSEESVLNIDMSAVTEEGLYTILLEGAAPNTDTIYRSITLDVISNDFSTMALEEPVDGQQGVSTLPMFTWLGSAAANSYSIEIATSPTFGNTIVDMASNITETTYNPAVTLDESIGYYWRVFPENECGKGAPLLSNSFQTVSFTCSTENSVDTPVNISGSGVPTVESKINVFADGIINDINVPLIKGNHEYFGDLRATLISPAGTEVVLFTNKCLNYNGNYNFGIDDEAPVNFQCPPNSGTAYRSGQPLSAFIGESTAGVWTLRINDNVGGNGGQLADWRLEFCASVNTTPPFLVTNVEMPVNPSEGRNLSNDFLLVEDDNNEEWELVYTLVNTPAKGSLALNGTPLAVGDEFTQSDIHWAKVRYTHEGTGDDTDYFRFTVRDNEGGWLGTLQFDLLMDATIMVNTAELLEDAKIRLYPNPTDAFVQVRFDNPTTSTTQISLIDVKGRVLSESTHLLTQNTVDLDVSNLASGVYFMRFRQADTVSYKKLVIE